MRDRIRRLAVTSLVVGILAAGLVLTLGTTERSDALVARGTTEWVSIAEDAAGAPVPNLGAQQIATDDAVSDDGRFVVFETDLSLDPRDSYREPIVLLSYSSPAAGKATKAAPPETSMNRDIYVRDRLLGTSTLLSVGWGQGEGTYLRRFDDGSSNAAISGNGRFVAFLTYNTNGDGFGYEGRSDAVVVDRDPDGDGSYDEDPLAEGYDGNGMPIVTRMPMNTLGDLGQPSWDGATNDVNDQPAMDVSISDDGSQVAVVTREVYDEGGNYHSVPVVIDRDVHRDGRFDEFSGEGAVRVTAIATPYTDNVQSIEVAGDGRFLAFDAYVQQTIVPEEGEPYVTSINVLAVVDRDLSGDGDYGEDRRVDHVVPNDDPGDRHWPYAPTISDDGRVIAYYEAINEGQTQVLVMDRGPADMDGTYPLPPFAPRLVSTPDGTTPASSITAEPDLSGDGRYLAAMSFAGDLPGECRDSTGPTDPEGNLYRCADVLVWDLAHPDQEPVVVSVTPSSEQADEPSTRPSLTDTGRYVSFTSSATALDPAQSGPTPDTPGDSPDFDVFIREFRPTLVGRDDPTDFGTVPTESGQSATRVVTFTNQATPGSEESWGPLIITGFRVGGPFTVGTHTCTGPLHRGDSCEVQVRYDPSAVGWQEGTLRADYDDRHWVEGQLAIPGETAVGLVGTGGPRPLDPPIFNATPDPTEFPDTLIGNVAASQVVTVRNLGEESFDIDTVGLTGTDPGDFRILSETCSATTITVAPSNCTVTVTFSPTAEGARTAALRFIDSAPGAPHQVVLNGFGTPRVPAFDATPNPLDFGTVRTDATPPVRTITVSNTGNGPFTIADVTLDGTDVEQFEIVGTDCDGEIEPEGTCTIDVEFAPSGAGPRSAVVAVDDDAPGGPHRIPVIGEGALPPKDPPIFDATPDPTEFPETLIGDIADPQVVTVRNVGEESFTVESVEIVGNHADDFQIVEHDCEDAVIDPPPSNCTVTVDFRPSEPGARTAVLRFTDTAPGEVHLVELKGSGEVRVPVFGATPNPLDFGFVRTDASPPVRTITITNTGNGPYTIDGFSLDGTDAGEFTINKTDCIGVVEPDDECTVDVRFSPKDQSRKSAAVVVDDTAPGRPHRITLTGSGQIGTPAFAADPDPVDFGPALIGTPPGDKVVTVTNTGDAPFAVTALDLAGPSAADFSIVSSTCVGATVSPTAACTVTVRATPTAPGARTAELRFTDTAPGSPHTVDLKADTPAPTLTLNPSLGPPGSVISVSGTGWPANLPVLVTFTGHDGAFAVTAKADGTFVNPDVLVLPRSQIGPREVVGQSTTPAGVTATAFSTFLVVTAPVDGTPGFVFRK
jgi:hypothetical protein